MNTDSRVYEGVTKSLNDFNLYFTILLTGLIPVFDQICDVFCRPRCHDAVVTKYLRDGGEREDRAGGAVINLAIIWEYLMW